MLPASESLQDFPFLYKSNEYCTERLKFSWHFTQRRPPETVKSLERKAYANDSRRESSANKSQGSIRFTTEASGARVYGRGRGPESVRSRQTERNTACSERRSWKADLCRGKFQTFMMARYRPSTRIPGGTRANAKTPEELAAVRVCS